MSNPPIIFLAFANEQDRSGQYLRDLPEEVRRLQATLEQAQGEGLCQVVVRPNATLDDILGVFLNSAYRDRIVIFHYGGHANSYQLLLEGANRQTQAIDAAGLAAFLGQQKGLQLVFLNACSTQPQVEALQRAGVPAVIATARAVKDDVAREFASLFYRSLAARAELKRGYLEAESAVKTHHGSGSTRGLYWDEPEITETWPWAFYEGKPGAADWRLPEAPLPDLAQAAGPSVMIGGAYFANAGQAATGNIDASVRAEGDIIAGNKEIHYHYYGAPAEPTKPKLNPRLPFEPKTVLIPAGPFWMGSEPGAGISQWETPRHQVDLPYDYWIGKYPVTNEQYAEFIDKTNYPISAQAGWDGQTPPYDKFDHPVTGVTWYDALEYCRWLSDQTGRPYTLPSEAEWEKAARGPDGSIYPWGDEWQEGRCHYGSDQTAPVKAYPAQRQHGDDPKNAVYDMVGNAPEWTSTLWGTRPAPPDPQFRYPWRNDGREKLTAGKFILRVHRGGAASDNIERLRCSARASYFPDKPGPPQKRHGFRVIWRPV
jgi:formylglycine-generating enzyme required for sulfatase activity